jgi:ferritin-like metal-binding protein YciE
LNDFVINFLVCQKGGSITFRLLDGIYQGHNHPRFERPLLRNSNLKKRRCPMPVNNAKELFVKMLSDVRQRTEKTTKIYEELSELAQDPNIKEALQSRAFLQGKDLTSLDRCFELIGEKPVPLSERLHDVFVEDFRRELAEIQAPAAKALFIVIKANHLMHLRIAEYVALIAMADVSGHLGVGVLLESCLADKLAFVERTRRLIRHAIETKHEIKLAA